MMQEQGQGHWIEELVRQAGRRQGSPFNAYMHVLDALQGVDDKGQPLLAPVERENPVESILLNELVEFATPLIGSIGPDLAEPTVGRNVEAELSELHSMMARQQEIIAAMQEELSNLRGRGSERDAGRNKE